jgi:uncharacterized protein (TIGR03083 family)
VSSIVSTYEGAARAVADAVDGIADDAWQAGGLGEWTVRDLVGHTSRALVTVIDYLVRPVDREVHASAAAYFAAGATKGGDDAGVAERGRQAGRDLGEAPASRFRALVDDAVRVARATDPDRVVHTFAGGMRVAAFLPTRTFELCVHGLDIAAATGVALDLPAQAVEEAVSIAAVAATRQGLGSDVLLALTGRRNLPPGFSVV